MLCLQHNIHTSCDLQTTDSWRNVSVLLRNFRGKWVEIIKNSGKMMLKILYESLPKEDLAYVINLEGSYYVILIRIIQSMVSSRKMCH